MCAPFPLVSTNDTQEKYDTASIAQVCVSCAPGRRATRARVPRFCLLEAESFLKIPASFTYPSSKTSSYPLRVEDKREEEEGSGMDTLQKWKERARILSKTLHQNIAFKKALLGFQLANRLWTETQESATLLVSPALLCVET